MKVKHRLPWLALVLATLALAVVAAGCGGGNEAATTTEPAATGATGAAGGGTTTEGGGGTAIKVGLVTDTGGVDDRGFNQFSIAGLKDAEEQLGVTSRIFVSNSADDYLPNLNAAAQDGNDLVIAVGFLLAPATIQTATAFPDIKFAGVDHFYGGDGCEDSGTCEQPNAVGMQYPSEESGYLAGVVAAMMTKSKVVSTVGGIKIPPVDNWIAGFQQAVYDTDPSIKVLNQYSQDFDDQAKCKEIALDQISQGSDVLFQVAGKCGLGALDAACQKGINAIGVDADQSFAGPCVITSALKPLQSSVFAMIKSVVDGTYKGGENQFFGVQDLPDAQLLAPFTDAVPQEVQDAAEAAKQKIVSGEIDPPSTIEAVKKP